MMAHLLAALDWLIYAAGAASLALTLVLLSAAMVHRLALRIRAGRARREAQRVLAHPRFEKAGAVRLRIHTPKHQTTTR